jgi:hypothetical protein
LINLRPVADCKIVTSYDQLVQCYIAPDLRIITNRNPLFITVPLPMIGLQPKFAVGDRVTVEETPTIDR